MSHNEILRFVWFEPIGNRSEAEARYKAQIGELAKVASLKRNSLGQIRSGFFTWM